MDRIGRYEVQREIGRGAMGIVYAATDPSIGRTVAIKTIRLDLLAEPGERAKLRERLFREAQSAGMLSHPHIVTIYDVGEEEGLAYIAMELVDGLSLDKVVLGGDLDGKGVLSLLSQTAAALDYAHKRGIVHRDIKPANLMIFERTTAKITDFGVAKFESQEATQAGLLIGTPNYMSPEQIQGQSVDGRSDQFSLAVIAYELLTGVKPFAAESVPALVFKIVHDEPAAVKDANPGLSWPVDTVVRRGLAKNPADRYPTCSDFSFALENACRPSKNWKPVLSGHEANSPTVVHTAPVVAASEIPEERVEEPVSKPLRVARILAVLVLVAGLVSALVVATSEYFAGSGTPATEIQDETVEKASPVERTVIRPPEPQAAEEVRPAELPGENEPAPEPTATSKSTRFVTNPPGALLAIDNNTESTCRAPCSQELEAGRHTLSATLDGYRRTLKIFETPKETEVFLNLEQMRGTIMIRSEPAGAAILIDGQPRAEKTPAVLNIPTGKHTITVERNGSREVQEIEIKDGAITNLSLKLAL